MARKKPAVAPVVPPASAAPLKGTYPLHEFFTDYVPGTDNPAAVVTLDGKKMIRRCAGVLVLCEQTGRDPNPLHLFCLSCLMGTSVDPPVYEQAQRAASAEGWKPSEKGDIVPGTLPPEVARALLAKHYRANDKHMLGTPDCDLDKWIAEGWPMVRALNLADGHELTPAGAKLTAALVAPDANLPDAVRSAPNVPDYGKLYARAAKKTKAKKSKPEAPSLPMVCTCGHGAITHRAADGKDKSSACRECPCRCYVQQKPITEPKAKRGKASAAA